MTLGRYIKARLEEQFLREQVGPATYDDYKRRVPMLLPFAALVLAVALAFSAANPKAAATDRIRVVLATDANNELDDQHAIAYLLFNSRTFDAEVITINRTAGGGGIDAHAAEAERIVRLSGAETRVPVVKGAVGSFDT